jgi:CheY-like chemotaxis protein
VKAVPRILVADDNTNIQKMVALAFEERGIDVVSVGNGEAAVRRIPDLAPDLVLADVFMPVRNGYEVCEFIKRDDRFSHVPVILLVGAFDPLDEKEARRVGADGVLKKPFVPPDPLIAMVTSALEKNPRVAAEMAKAREVPAAPAPEPFAPILEAPARMEPKPLPEFPEPTPEEAAAIYGFGKGRGRLSDDDKDEPIPPKDEAAIDTAEAEEDFDGTSTASDWRRNAANFEVPQELGGKLPFASEESFDSATFPPEADIPPVRTPVTDAGKNPGPVQQPSWEQAWPQFDAPSIDAEAGMAASPAEHATMPEGQSSIEAKPDSVPETAEPGKSKLKGWVESIASPSEYAEGGWMSAIFRTRSKEKGEKGEEAPSVPQPVAETGASADSLHAEEESSHRTPSRPESDEKPFPKETNAVTDSWLAPPPPPVLSTPLEPHLAPPSMAPEPADDLASVPVDAAGSLRDPDLELPAAPPITPEPLLVNEEEPSGSSPFSGTSEQLEPLHSFLPPPPPEPPVEEPHLEEPEMPEPFNTSVFAPAESASVMNAADERIPTAPPPNREALADIPFLTPRPEPPEGDKTHTQDSPSVDAVVAKVLEKLEPQLHDLLSQGLLKPLVENLLQQELAKKEK